MRTHSPNRPLALLVAAGLSGGLAAGCKTVNSNDLGRPGPTSLRVTLLSPTNLGSPTSPVTDTTLVFNVEAVKAGSGGTTHDAFNGKVYAYVFFENSLTPTHNAVVTPVDAGSGALETLPAVPLAAIELTNGWAMNQAIDLSQNPSHGLPSVYGPTVLWLEDASPETGLTGVTTGSYATGTSPTIYYPDPLVWQARKPLNPSDPHYNWAAPLLNKETTFDGCPAGQPCTRPGSAHLIVTAVFAQAFNVEDLDNPDFGGINVYAFSVPTLQVGQYIQTMNGALTEFNGYTELNFPTYQAVSDASGSPLPGNPAAVPTYVLTNAQFQDQHFMETREAEIVEMDGGKVCPFTADPTGGFATAWQKYGQWTMDMGLGCGQGAGVSVETGTTIPQLDMSNPATWNQPIAKVVGVAQNIAGISTTSGSPYSFFLIVPRNLNDLTCSFAGCAGH